MDRDETIRAEALREAAALCETLGRRMTRHAGSVAAERARRRALQAELAQAMAQRLRAMADIAELPAERAA
jgi:hypothetical protein